MDHHTDTAGGEGQTAGTVLIVEDEEKLALLLRDYLARQGFVSSWLSSGEKVAEEVRRDPPDLILLDLMLPGKDGLTVCREIRAFSLVPIIMVTARIEEIDRLLGLELGADDYVCKPYSPREVVARVKTVLRRTRGVSGGGASGLTLNQESCRAFLNGEDLKLTAVEFKLLQLLARHEGRIFSRDELMARIYPDERVVCDRTIDSHIKKLRKKIGAVSSEELVHAVYGVGYRYETGG